MSDSFHFRIDKRALVSAQVHAAAEEAVGAAAEHLLTEANRTVPLEEAILEHSGKVTQDGTRAAISYDTPYAVVQHEKLELRHSRGRRAKWLELTLMEQAAAVRGFLAERLRRRLR
jgi:hypothetical protein